MGHRRGRGQNRPAKQFPSSRAGRRASRINESNDFAGFIDEQYVEHFSSQSSRRTHRRDDHQVDPDDLHVKKTWSKHNIKSIIPKNERQSTLVDAVMKGKHVFAHGSAGTGKTFLAMYCALMEVFDKETPYDRIIIVRSAVPTRNMGFTPGTVEEKAALFEAPYSDICTELLTFKNAYRDLKEIKKIEFMTTSYVRGMTFDNAIIIVDECQSATYHELYSVMTRVGRDSKVIVCGDGVQDDLHSQRNTERSGFDTLKSVMSSMNNVEVVEFTEQDIVRSGFVKEFIIRSQKLAQS